MYDVANIDLTAVQNAPVQLVERGKTFTELALLAIADGASFQIRFGVGPWITIPAPFTMKPTGDAQRDGLFWRNPNAQPGIAVELLISYDSNDLSPLLA